MKPIFVFLTFFMIASHAISGVHMAGNNAVISLDSIELCPDFITVTPVGDCGSFLFNLNHIGDFGNMIWNWGDGGSNSGANNVGHTFFEPGEYTVCVQAWTGDCPDGVEVCTTVVVPDCEFECPEGIVATELECGLWSFVINPGNAVSVGNWVFGDGQFAEVSGNTVTHEFSESGEYTVQVNSSLSQPCFDNYFTITIEVAVCDEECGLEIETLSLDGNILVLGASGFPDNAQVHWELNGTIVNIGDITTFELGPGENQICAFFETPECPQGVFWCDTFFIEDPEECPFELIVEETEDCGCYDFAISEPDAAGQYIWNMGDTIYSTFSHTTTYCFEPGFQTMYVQLIGSNYQDCENVPFVYQWEVPECEFECPESIVATHIECGLWEFSIQPGAEVVMGNWDFGDGSFEDSDGNTITHEFLESGVYIINVNSALNQPCFNNYFTITIEVEICDSECGLEIETLSLDGNILVLGASGFPDNAQVHWELNGTTVNIGSTTTFELQPGANEICVYYETPECPQGVFWCETWTIEGENDCPGEEDFYAEQIEGSCTSWIFEIGSFIEGELVIWDYDDGTSEVGGHFAEHTFSEEGQYEVCAYYSSPLCPDTVVICVPILVECAENPCELDIEVEQDGDTLLFYPYNYPENAVIGWQVNGEWFGTGEMFSVSIANPGSYQVCASYETPECPQGVFWCETWTIEGENDCPGEEDFYAGNVEGTCTSWVFEIGSFVEGEEVFWDYGDGTWEWGGHFTDHQYQTDGEYQVCANYHSPLCPDTVILCQTILVECGETPCELDMEVDQDGDTLLFYPYNYPENAVIGWQVNGEWFGTGEMFSVSIANPGSYQVCASYETPECPQGVFWCETFFIEDPEECPFELIVEETEDCGCYDFAISEPDAAGQYIWNMGDTLYSTFSHTTTYCFESGFQTMYVQFMGSNYPDCENVPLVYQWEVPDCEDSDCYWFAFEMATNLPGVSFGLDWSFTELNGEMVGNGTVQVQGDTTVCTGEVCIGIGCYILEFTAPFPINLENLDIDFVSIIDPLIPLTIEWIQDDNPYTVHAQIGIAETCNWTVSIDENPLDAIKIFPVPTREVLNIQLGQETQTNIRIYSTSGRLVLEQTIQQSGPIDVRALSAGLYLVQLQQDNEFKTFSIPLLN